MAIQKEASGQYSDQYLFDYQHTHGDQAWGIYVWLEPQEEKGHVILKIVEDEEADIVGFISGGMEEKRGKRNFYVGTISNQTIHNDATGELFSSIPRVVAATIEELLRRGIISAWYSSYSRAISQMARDMYERHFG